MATDPAQASERQDSVTGVRNVGRAGDSEPPRRYSAGDVVDGRFRLVRKIGAGGMGTVWVAHNLVLDVQVGIKLITFRGSKNGAALARRLLDEARSAARLGHAAVIKVHDFGITVHGDPFIAMELLEGEDLAAVLERQARVGADTALQMLLPIAHGLAAAHDKGIVHRDIKPENIFLAREDDGEVRPKILDFGIARMVDSPTKLTLEGTPLGTPEYMSPEIARGEVAEATSDIWSFSVVLYELLTGVCPFHADNYNALMQRILTAEPEPLSARGTFDADLEAIIHKGLEKDPQRRWSSMREMGRALARVLVRHGIAEDICGTSLRRGWLLGAGERTTEVSTASRLSSDSELAASRATLPELPAESNETPNRGPDLPDAAAALASESPAPQSLEPGTPNQVAPRTPGYLTSPNTDEFQLAAIAEMNRGGDPVDVLKRAEQRRMSLLVGLVVVFCLALVASILFGTGIIGIG